MFSAMSAEPHIYDWVYHGVGEFSSGGIEFESPAESPGETNGYQYLKRIKSATFDQDWRAEWRAGPKRYVGLYVLGEPGTTYYSAQGLIAADVGDKGHAVLERHGALSQVPDPRIQEGLSAGKDGAAEVVFLGGGEDLGADLNRHVLGIFEGTQAVLTGEVAARRDNKRQASRGGKDV